MGGWSGRGLEPPGHTGQREEGRLRGGHRRLAGRLRGRAGRNRGREPAQAPVAGAGGAALAAPEVRDRGQPAALRGQARLRPVLQDHHP
eukprot:5225872-Lingulodinium_polyedra.AAC.1